jgi:hypothetical protein
MRGSDTRRSLETRHLASHTVSQAKQDTASCEAHQISAQTLYKNLCDSFESGCSTKVSNVTLVAGKIRLSEVHFIS